MYSMCRTLPDSTCDLNTSSTIGKIDHLNVCYRSRDESVCFENATISARELPSSPLAEAGMNAGIRVKSFIS